MADRIQFRRDTLANWTKANPILLDGELVLVATDETKPYVYDSKKVGDGVHAFNDLEMLGYECLQELGDSTLFPVSQKVVTDNVNLELERYNELLKKTKIILNGKYYNNNGKVQSYSLSKTIFINIPEEDCIIEHFWGIPVSYGLFYFDKDFKFVSAVEESAITENNIDRNFEWKVNEITIPINARYIGIHYQNDNTFNIESEKDLFVTIQSFLVANREEIVANREEIVANREEIVANIDKFRELFDETIISKNLYYYEQGNFGYIHSTKGHLVKDENAEVSPFIKVKPNTIYTLHRESNIGTHCVRLIDDNENISVPLKEDGTNYSSYECNSKNQIIFKTKEDTKFVQFTIKFNNKEFTNIQLEEGNEFTGYEKYGVIHLNRLSEEIKELLFSKSNNDNEIITIANSDKIGFFSNSFLNGYCMLGKHAINNLSMYSDYIMYNYGHSGDDLLELLARVHKNEKWLGDTPVQEWGIKYGVIAMQDNDGALFSASSDTYYENGKKLANAIKAMGGIPILSTEHDWNYYYYNFARLAQEQNLILMNWGNTASKLAKVFPPFWYNGHPATRTAWMWSYGMQNYLNTLPRPEKSIKIFRVRPSINTSNIENLIYEDILSRAERFEEIGCGVSMLTEDTEKYFDRLDTGLSKYTTFKDEYQKLQSKTSTVDFSDYCLIEMITPYDANGIKNATLNISATGVDSVFIKKINSLSNPLPATRYVAFGLEGGTLNIGQTFEVTGGVFNDNIKGTYTVMGVVDGIVITTTLSTGKTTSGTDNPITNLEGVTLKGSYDYPSSDYMQRYNKPLGEWIEVEMSENGEIILDNYLDTAMDFDKFSVLLVGENISLSDVYGVIKGIFKKENSNKRLPLFPKKGISLLDNNLFTDEDSWQGITNLDSYSPIRANNSSQIEELPDGVTIVRIMSKGQSVQQKLTISNTETFGYGFKTLQIRVTARYFPEYVDSDSKWQTSVIKRGTYDCVKLAVKIGRNQNDTNPIKVGVIHVGAWWNEFIIETPYYGGDFIILEAEDSNIQIAKCDVIQII